MNILFRCDGSSEIGMGHVVRCLALADELNYVHHCNIHFAMRESQLGITTVQQHYPVLQPGVQGFGYPEWLRDCIRQSNAQILVLDARDGLQREELKQLKQSTGVKVVTIDDPEDKRLEADFAFYPPVPQLEAMDWSEFNGQYYAGWEYILLRHEFSQKYSTSTIAGNSGILVSMGGTDPKNLTLSVSESLERLEEDFILTVILGPGYGFESEFKKAIEGFHHNCIVHKDPENMAEILSRPDFAVITFGVTAFELAALGTPAIYLCHTRDHAQSALALERAGAGMSAGLIDSDVIKDVSLKAASLCGNKQKLAEMRNSAQRIGIRNGTKRVANMILGKSGKML